MYLVSNKNVYWTPIFNNYAGISYMLLLSKIFIKYFSSKLLFDFNY